MDTVSDLLLAFISLVIVNNLVFTKFLGICPYIGVSGRIDMAFGMGMAVTFVVTLSGTLTYMINNWILMSFGLEVARYVCFILVIAGAVQLVEMYVRKFFPSLYDSFGIFLPLITVNCARLGYLHKGNKETLYKRLDELLDIAKNTLEVKRKVIQRYIDSGLFPYTKRYLGTLRNHFATIGINGVNECVRNFTDDK